MVSKKHYEQDVAYIKLATNYENHTRQDDEHFIGIRSTLEDIEKKIDKLNWRVAGISSVVSFLVSIIVFIMSKGMK